MRDLILFIVFVSVIIGGMTAFIVTWWDNRKQRR